MMERTRESRATRAIVVVILAYMALLPGPSWGQDAMEYYNLGLESSLANKRIGYFSKALALNPKLAEAYEKRGIHYYYQGQLDMAIQDYTRAMELRPHRASNYQMRGLAYLKKAHGEGLMAEANRLALMYSSFGVEESRAALHKSIDDFSRAVELSPQLTSSYSYRAVAYLVLGRIDEALRDCSTAIDFGGDPKSTARAYATRARIYKQLGQNELSQSDYDKSVSLDPYSPDYPPLHVPLISHHYGDSAGLKTTSRTGLLIIFLLTFVAIFRLTLRAPKKGS
jgi:tetratricopeptide (TPR) repeat protein